MADSEGIQLTEQEKLQIENEAKRQLDDFNKNRLFSEKAKNFLKERVEEFVKQALLEKREKEATQTQTEESKRKTSEAFSQEEIQFLVAQAIKEQENQKVLLQDERSENKNNMGKTKDNLLDLSAAIKNNRKDLRKLKQNGKSLDRKFERMEKRWGKLDLSRKDLLKLMEKNRGKLDKVSDELEKEQNVRDAFKKKVEDLKNQITEMEKTKEGYGGGRGENLRTALADAESELKIAEKNVEALQDKHDGLSKEQNRLNQHADNLGGKIQGMEGAIALNREDKKRNERQIELKNQEQVLLHANVKLNQNGLRLQNNNENLFARKSHLLNELSAQQELLKSTKDGTKKDFINVRISEIRANLSDVNTRIESNQYQINQIQSKVAQNNSNISQIRNDDAFKAPEAGKEPPKLDVKLTELQRKQKMTLQEKKKSLEAKINNNKGKIAVKSRAKLKILQGKSKLKSVKYNILSALKTGKKSEPKLSHHSVLEERKRKVKKDILKCKAGLADPLLSADEKSAYQERLKKNQDKLKAINKDIKVYQKRRSARRRDMALKKVFTRIHKKFLKPKDYFSKKAEKYEGKKGIANKIKHKFFRGMKHTFALISNKADSKASHATMRMKKADEKVARIGAPETQIHKMEIPGDKREQWTGVDPAQMLDQAKEIDKVIKRKQKEIDKLDKQIASGKKHLTPKKEALSNEVHQLQETKTKKLNARRLVLKTKRENEDYHKAFDLVSQLPESEREQFYDKRKGTNIQTGKEVELNDLNVNRVKEKYPEQFGMRSVDQNVQMRERIEREPAARRSTQPTVREQALQEGRGFTQRAQPQIRPQPPKPDDKAAQRAQRRATAPGQAPKEKLGKWQRFKNMRKKVAEKVGKYLPNQKGIEGDEDVGKLLEKLISNLIQILRPLARKYVIDPAKSGLKMLGLAALKKAKLIGKSNENKERINEKVNPKPKPSPRPQPHERQKTMGQHRMPNVPEGERWVPPQKPTDTGKGPSIGTHRAVPESKPSAPAQKQIIGQHRDKPSPKPGANLEPNNFASRMSSVNNNWAPARPSTSPTKTADAAITIGSRQNGKPPTYTPTAQGSWQKAQQQRAAERKAPTPSPESTSEKKRPQIGVRR